MNPLLPKFGGGPSGSILHPVILIALLIAVVLIFTLPKRHMVIPVLFMAFLVPIGQQFYVAGVHLFILRVVILIALVRAVQHIGRFRWNACDTVFTVGVVTQAIAVILLYQQVESAVNQMGFIWDFLGGYFLLRLLIQDEGDIDRTIQCLAILMTCIAVAMTIEQVTRQNVFGLLGGVNPIPEIRDGKVRSQGVFQHALTAGTFGASSLPLFVLLWKKGKAKAVAVLGIFAAGVVTITTQTSTSVLTAAAALVGIAFWPLRKQMSKIRWAIAGAILGLALVMKAPVWYVIAHVDLTGSSSSYHRAVLIDQFVNHFSSWWLIGTGSNADWGWGMWDAQNMYVATGEAGGLIALVCFIAVIVLSFRRAGNLRRRAGGSEDEWIPWLLGATVFAHMVAFFGVQYFDQVRIAWFAILAMISACTVTRQAENTAVPRSFVTTRYNIESPWRPVVRRSPSD